MAQTHSLPETGWRGITRHWQNDLIAAFQFLKLLTEFSSQERVLITFLNKPYSLICDLYL
jgi:hypothetical protein